MNKKSVFKCLYLYLLRLVLFPFIRFASFLKWKHAVIFGNVLGDLAFCLSKRYRNIAFRNISSAFGDQMSEKQILDMVRQVFRNFSRVSLEFFIVQNLTQDEIKDKMPIIGLEHLAKALLEEKGAILVTAHLGNWELLARRLVLEGFKMNVIARDSDDPTANGIINSLRQKGGYNVFSRDNAVGPAIKCLKRNEVLGILPDQNTYGSCVFADFFGRLAATSVGPAVFSLRTGAPILLTFAPRMPDGSYQGIVYPPIKFQATDDRTADIEKLVKLFTAAIESEIRKYPDQWLWLHDRWKRQPTENNNGSELNGNTNAK